MRPTVQRDAVEAFRASIRQEFERRFPRSAERHRRGSEGPLLDGTSHAVRWTEPFAPIATRAEGAWVEDLDGHRAIDYWQGHFANLFGHNPSFLREALAEALARGEGLHTGLVHEVEYDVAERLARATGTETVRFTTAGTLGTFYATVLARAFTGRDRVLKISGGWHGSQPYSLMGVTAHDGAFESIESEGLSSSLPGEVLLARFNDVEGLERLFGLHGDAIACLVIEPLMGAAGGFVASRSFIEAARRLTERHGALLVCDEILTGFRFRPGPLIAAYGVAPDLIVAGKIVGGGMPVAAVCGRRDVLALSSRSVGRVKFEGGTYSSHALSMIASREMLRRIESDAEAIYPPLRERSRRLRAGLARVAESSGVPLFVTGADGETVVDGSFVLVHAAIEGARAPACPEELAARRHPAIGPRLLKSVLALEGVSTRNGLGAVSLAHDEDAIEETIVRYAAALERFRAAGIA